jgi:hypothetical protein
LRERVAAEYQQMASAVEQAKGQYIEAASTVIRQLDALTAVSFPELAFFAGKPQQLAGALQMMAKENPARYAEIQQFAERASMVMERTQRVQAEQQQAMQQQAHAEFNKYAAEQDAKAFAKETPESLAQIRNLLYEDGKKAGYSKADIEQAWNTIPALRNADWIWPERCLVVRTSPN